MLYNNVIYWAHALQLLRDISYFENIISFTEQARHGALQPAGRS